jgi:negative regulator of sigma E activity
MSNSIDERLSAWLDGALDESEAKALEAEMANDPALANRLAELQASDVALRAAFDAPLSEPVPDRLMALLGDAPSAKVIDFAAAKTRRDAAAKPAPARRDWAKWGALAATIVGGVFLIAQPGIGPKPDAAQATLNAALDGTASGQQVALASGGTLTPKLSFAAKDGRYCREFATGGQSGVACRGAAGWKVEAMVKDDAAQNGEGGYATAGGKGAALDDVYARLGAGDPLDPAAEKNLIAKGWHAPR